MGDGHARRLLAGWEDWSGVSAGWEATVTGVVPQHLATLGNVDEEWLAEARQAQQRLIHAEHEADVARAAFHRAVQRLVLHGAEPQDVAAALGISDQQLYEMAHKARDSAR